MRTNDATKKFDWAEAKQRLESLRRVLVDHEELTVEQSDRLLRERAQQLAKIPPAIPDTHEVMEIVQFRLGTESFAVATEFVLELTRPPHITPIPQTDSHFLGITNLRGEVTAILDLGEFLGISNSHVPASQVLVLGHDKVAFGITVGEIEDVGMLQRASLANPTDVGGKFSDLLLGCTADGMLVFDGYKLLACEELYIDQID